MKAEQIIAHIDTLDLTTALWWFIDNMPADSLASTEVRLYLRERVRNAARRVCVVAGDPMSGLSIHGPFDSHEAAQDYVDGIRFQGSWWITEMEQPS